MGMKKLWILITGATSGIGLATAKRLISDGHNVILTGRNQEKLNSCIVSIKQEFHSSNLFSHQMDITQLDEITQTRDYISNLVKDEGLDLIINNAGYAQGGFLLDQNLDTMRNQYETNLFGMINVTKIFLSILLKSKKPRIFNVGSVQGRMLVPFYSLYCTSKHAFRSATHLLRLELKSSGIKVVLLEPGGTKSNFQSYSIESQQDIDRPSYYDPMYKRLQESNYKPLEAMPSIEVEKIANSISKLVGKRRLKPSYLLSNWAKLYIFLLKITPRIIAEWIILRNFGLKRKGDISKIK